MLSRFGRYELVRPLGRGGMAEVFLARQRGPGGFEKRLVIKRILPERASSPGLLRRFFEEARLHAGLSHGNLVPIFDFGRVGNEYFLALELVDGCDLSALLEALPAHTLPPALCAYVGSELCHALEHVHRQKLIHRDVTPRNVLLSRDGEVKLTDFGVALGAVASAGLGGTLGYMAPEQEQGGSVDARGDVYSLGIVLAEAGLRGATDAGLDQIVARATSASPDDRFANAAAMGDALEAASTTLGVSRAIAARTLADLVRAYAAPLDTPDEIAPAASKPIRATYWRDDTTAASFVDELMAPAPPPRRRRAFTWLGAALAVAGVAGIFWLRRDEHATALPTPPPAPPIDARVPADRVVTTPPHVITSVPASTPGSGELEVICEPWCVLTVDGARRGEDGRLHRLRVPAGRHRLTTTRLEDRQSRAVTVNEGATQTVTFRFD